MRRGAAARSHIPARLRTAAIEFVFMAPGPDAIERFHFRRTSHGSAAASNISQRKCTAHVCLSDLYRTVVRQRPVEVVSEQTKLTLRAVLRQICSDIVSA